MAESEHKRPNILATMLGWVALGAVLGAGLGAIFAPPLTVGFTVAGAMTGGAARAARFMFASKPGVDDER
ncbi:hypothetical protein [uncultured Tateyamaria sp.]|uniref:hypothetical protein n=1 Tax=uncultured Tateyamaria sp. TaxID=455651 RepID=UPI0026203637|nr:hypothetical protein [uncultured Tateyamaria sp.]